MKIRMKRGTYRHGVPGSCSNPPHFAKYTVYKVWQENHLEAMVTINGISKSLRCISAEILKTKL